MIEHVRGLKGFVHAVLQDLDHLTLKGYYVHNNDELYDRFMAFLNTVHTALHPMHLGDIETFFMSVDINKENMQSLLQVHCLNVVKKFPNVYTVLMYGFSFAYSLRRFERRIYGYDNFMDIYTFMWNKFMSVIRNRFYNEGGWSGLERFCTGHNLPFVLEFVHSCYNQKLPLLTFIEIARPQKDFCFTIKWHPFGIHSECTIALLLINLGRLRNFISSEFAIGLSSYPLLISDIQEFILKMAVDLEHLLKSLIPRHAAVKDCLAEAMENFLLNLKDYQFARGLGAISKYDMEPSWNPVEFQNASS